VTDKALIRFAKEFRDGLLAGRASDRMCGVVCWPLAALLRVNGVDCEAEGIEWSMDGEAEARNHWFIQLADGRILDPTADQFGLKPVYLGPMPQLYLDWQEKPQ
jgi:hypothetical protein